jgi:hypothetical protein
MLRFTLTNLLNMPSVGTMDRWDLCLGEGVSVVIKRLQYPAALEALLSLWLLLRPKNLPILLP